METAREQRTVRETEISLMLFELSVDKDAFQS